MNVIALIVAAGRGERLGTERPKQYHALGGIPILRRSVEAFLHHPAIDAVRVVVHPDDFAAYAEAVAGLALLEPVEGGASRQESVRHGLESLRSYADTHDDDVLVLIHDAARPLVSEQVISKVIAALAKHPGAIPAVPVTDSLIRRGAGARPERVPRDDLWRIQTPQGFHLSKIIKSHQLLKDINFTDDSSLAEAAGLDVHLVEGDEENLKITRPEDLGRAETILSRAESGWRARGFEDRTGHGIDVHRFGPGDHVTLCGVTVPHAHGLVGHSDADAGLHAITDAILGAIAAGDIGDHFPPAEARWRDASSDIFLRHAADLTRHRGGKILHVDLTLVCEAPKIKPHRAAMVKRVAEILSIATDRVSVKATTTEGLGFTGRREGILAQATASVRLRARGEEEA